MENLAATNVRTLNLESMSDDELRLITDKALSVKIDRVNKRVSELTNKQAKFEAELKMNKAELKKISNESDEMRRFIDVLGFAVNSYKLQILKSKAATRVYELLGNDTSSIIFTVWSTNFFKKIYLDIARHFRVNKCANINVRDFDEACHIAEIWVPSHDYLREKLEEMQRKALTGTLKQDRVMALNIYLRDTNNGAINPFC